MEDDHVSETFCRELAADKRFGVLGLTLDDLMRILRERPGVEYAAFVSALFDAYGERQGKPLAGDRSPEYVKSLPLLHRLWPRARFVHIIRDGRDVWLSVSRWQKGAARYPTWETDPIVTTACWWERNVRLAREAGSRLGPDLYHELRYEALVADPGAECARLCAFLGLPYDEAMLRFHEGRTLADPGLDAKKAWRPVTPGLRSWRTEMVAPDVARFEAAAGALLDELGYPRGAVGTHAGTTDQGATAEHVAAIRRSFEAVTRRKGDDLPVAWSAGL
jgi:hypothetical protein